MLGPSKNRIQHAGGQRKGNDVVADRPPEVLMHFSERRMGQFDGADHVERVALHQHDVGTLHRDIRAGTDCEADIGLGQSRSVVHAVADHADLLALRLEFLDLACLVARQHVGEHSVDPETLRDALCRALVVSGQHDDLDAARAQRLDRFHRRRSHRIGDGDQTHELAAHCEVNDRPSGALQFLGFCAKLAEVDLVLRHQQLVAEQCRLAVDLGLRALAFEVLESGRLGCLHVGGPAQDCLGQGMVRSCFHGRGRGQQLILGGTGSHHQVHHLGLAHRQRAGLVEDDDVQLGCVLQRRRVLEQDAVHGAEPGSDHDRHRGCQPKRIGARDHEDGDREAECEQQGLADPPVPDDEGEQTHNDRGQDQPLRRAIRQELRGRLGVLRFLDELDDLGERRVRADLGCAILERAALVDGRADHRVADFLGHRHRFAREHRFVDQGRTFQHGPVDRDLVPRPDHDGIAGNDLGGRHLQLLAVTQHGCLGRRQIHEGADGFGCTCPCAHFEPVSEQDEDQQDCRRFVELLAAIKERRADAEQISGADAEDDEHRHIGDTAAERTVGCNDEGPDRIEDGGAGQNEQDEVQPQAEWWRDLNEVHAHRREDEDRQAEGERDPEAVAHVADHGLHVHAGAVAHFVGHGIALFPAMRLVVGLRVGWLHAGRCHPCVTRMRLGDCGLDLADRGRRDETCSASGGLRKHAWAGLRPHNESRNPRSLPVLQRGWSSPDHTQRSSSRRPG